MSLLCVYHKVRYQKANVLCQNFLDYLIKKFLPSCAMVFFQKWYIIESRYPANISTLFQRCLLVGATSDVGQRQINVETTLCISTSEFITSNNVESMLCISTLIWTTLDNLETTLSFSALIWTTLANVETTLWKWPFLKRKRQIISKRIYGVRSFNYFFVFFFTLLHMLVESIEEYLLGRENSLNIMKDTALLELNLNCFTL